MFKKYLLAFAISVLPIVELRGAIPIALFTLDLDFWSAIPVIILGNMFPVPFILLFFKFVYKWLSKVRYIGPVLQKINKKGEEKADKIRHIEFWGLFFFVAIPLPGTGAWTGALIATILGTRFKKAFFAIFLGVLTAGTIVSIIFYALPEVFQTLFL